MSSCPEGTYADLTNLTNQKCVTCNQIGCKVFFNIFFIS
jgi:hypothetical protein